jgi:hypothetical protein
MATILALQSQASRARYANFECKLVDSSLIRKYSLFVLEVVKAHVAASPKYPKMIHYRGDGEFMISGENTPAAIASCSSRRCCERWAIRGSEPRSQRRHCITAVIQMCVGDIARSHVRPK